MPGTGKPQYSLRLPAPGEYLRPDCIQRSHEGPDAPPTHVFTYWRTNRSKRRGLSTTPVNVQVCRACAARLAEKYGLKMPEGS